ncbi:MAG TPA: valine--tRNA ligase [Candidatus Polarisedimenticolia bacterium]|jgi:valyl-tRNA synthetase
MENRVTSSTAGMERAFDPARVEPRWRALWEERSLYRADPASDKPPFCMVIPPPNITGRLHVGHGLNNTLQDMVARWKRMSGYDVLWVPGSDHASIATHVMIERELEKEGLTRQQLGREKFMERAWAWKEKFGGEIGEQLRRLGASCDWSRERFTMDPGLSAAVREVFVRLYEDGLIYRDRYLINWCPRCRTAVSDLEVVHKEMQGKLWTVRYPLEGGGWISVATTRPETILGDAAVAVHPEDDRHRAVVGRTAIVPAVGRRIPVVADPFVDPNFGTGAVKVTPAHDPNDFLAGRRLGLDPIVVMDESARMTSEAGPYSGMDRFVCRERLLDQLRSEGLLLEEKDHLLSLGRCQRCDTIVEPMISLQWFVKIEPLARPALEAVESGRIRFVPDQWRKTYYEWMRNIKDWCISRQLWWGHRIPAWYCDSCGVTIVSRRDPDKCGTCGCLSLTQDPDVLDTWFSSGLWAFSTLGWPESTAELRRYYPTTLLVTGYDIIFFWVARMVMMGLKFMDEIPFKDVYFNGLVRDAKGEKISKMKGNTVDFFELMETYGTDAVRLTYASLSSPGSDVALAPGRLDGSRAFANKIWNAVRFARPHLEAGAWSSPPRREHLSEADRWILSRCSRVAQVVDEAMESYRFDEATAAIYRFAWHELCDWYLEMSKPALAAPNTPAGEAARGTLGHVIDRLLRMLHPFMPFITEELWQSLPRPAGSADRPVSIAIALFPLREPEMEDAAAERALEILMEQVTVRRNLAAGKEALVARDVPAHIRPFTEEARQVLERHRDTIAGLTRSAAPQIVQFSTAREGWVPIRGVTSCTEFTLFLTGGAEIEAERARLNKEIERLAKELTVHEAKLANEGFLSRAKAEAVEKVRAGHRDLTDRIARIRKTLEQLGA